MFLGLFQKDLFKGRRMKFEAAFFQTKLLSRKVCRLPCSPVLLRKFTNTKMAAAVKKLPFTGEELLLHVLVGFKTEKEGEGFDWETVKAKWDELNKKFIEKYHKNFQEKFLQGVCKQQEQQHF